MSQYKNAILIGISIILFIYAGFISIFPSSYAKKFDVNAFEQKALNATGLNITFTNLGVKIKPNFTTVITASNIQVQYPDKQPLFSAKSAELTTTPACILSNKVIIKNLNLRHVKYDDQILPSGENKLSFLPAAFDPSYFGKKKMTIVSGPVYVRGLDISYTESEPYSYKTDSQREAEYSQVEVKDFLSSLNFKNVDIK